MAQYKFDYLLNKISDQSNYFILNEVAKGFGTEAHRKYYLVFP